MKNPSTVYLIIGLIIIAFGAYIAVHNNWAGLAVNSELFTNAPSIFMKYGILVIAVERAVMVYVGMRFEGDKVPLKKAINNANKNIEVEKALPAPDTAKITNWQTNIDSNTTKLETIRNETRTVALRFVFLLGIILAISGVSILGDILEVPKTWGDGQQYVYGLLNIIVTGGLIGGGSKSFHEFTSQIKDYTQGNKS